MIAERKIVKGQQCASCYRAAFYLKEEPTKYQLMLASMLYGHEKTNFKADDFSGTLFPPKCQWCHAQQMPGNYGANPEFTKDFDYETGERIKNG